MGRLTRKPQSDEFEKIMLYYQYLKELYPKMGLDLDKEWAGEEAYVYDLIHSPELYDWIDIYVNETIEATSTEEMQLVGFLIVGRDEACHPFCDYFIAQAYIKKDFRNKGIMTRILKEYVGRHAGDYCLLIANGNPSAEIFWRNRFTELGFEINEDLPKIKGTIDYSLCKQLGFYRQRKRKR